MQSASTRRKFVVDQKGRRSAVILPLREYEQLMGDLHDLAVVAERRKEVPIDVAELKRRLNRRAPV
ncbi:MAG TPA: type II toxin-antitoxin system Phd/YefM family antitoxin [Thermoplasmata archaeon]|jgi:PHD/YefM family antitoxin component YafN of YafNO toxin-antitoxin module|nr:type II toxin-antitoxin system Phd/YefM family antitoxin [Thermoplasmata archaeon]